MAALHSFQRQDEFVLRATGGQRGGFFLDSGASDGFFGSNTLTLEAELGWTGICIEPNEQLFAQLAARRSCVCLNCCLYDRDGDVDFLEAAQVYGGILAEYEPGHLQFARAFVARQDGVPPDGERIGPGDGPRTVRKQARTIGSILREYAAPPVIDYWSLDTEGSELAILQSFPFTEYRVRFLTVEHNHSPVRSRIAEFLAGQGFRRVADLGIDDAYAWTGDPPPAGDAWRHRGWSGRTGRPGRR